MTVEFEAESEDRDTDLRHVVNTGDFSVDPLLIKVEEDIKDDRRIEVGRDIREDKYEIPKLRS